MKNFSSLSLFKPSVDRLFLSKILYMLKKDYFLRLVEELGKTLAKILELRKQDRLEDAQELIEEVYEGYFQFNSEYVLSKKDSEIMQVLMEENKLHQEHIKIIAELLIQEGEIHYQWDELLHSQNCLRKAHILLEYLNETNPSVFSMERKRKIDRILKFQVLIENELNDNH